MSRPDQTAEIRSIIERYKEYHPRTFPHIHSGLKEWKLIKARLANDRFTVADLLNAVDGCHRSPFHQGENDRGKKYDTLELIVRDAGHVQSFIEIMERQAKEPVLSEKTRRTLRARDAYLERRLGEQ